MTTAASAQTLFTTHQQQPQQDAASLFERQRTFVAAHQATITPIHPGRKVTSRVRGTHVGLLLRIDDPRAWAGSLRFPDTDEKNLPAQEEVTAHVAKCIGEGLMLGKVPVAWYFGVVLWDSADRLDEFKDPTPNTEIFADRPDVLKILAGCAETDMRKARNHNGVIMTGTRRGVVALDYDRATGTYTLTTQDGGSWQVAGKRATIKPEIINLYTVSGAEGQGEAARAA
ncbi:MAG TPA: hypothetical protein VGB98_25785 [Pyrinomonadaceae bacterium]